MQQIVLARQRDIFQSIRVVAQRPAASSSLCRHHRFPGPWKVRNYHVLLFAVARRAAQATGFSSPAHVGTLGSLPKLEARSFPFRSCLAYGTADRSRHHVGSYGRCGPCLWQARLVIPVNMHCPRWLAFQVIKLGQICPATLAYLGDSPAPALLKKMLCMQDVPDAACVKGTPNSNLRKSSK